jgi:hypothetical protein
VYLSEMSKLSIRFLQFKFCPDMLILSLFRHRKARPTAK